MESAAEIRERELQEREFKVPELSLPGYARLRKAVEAVPRRINYLLVLLCIILLVFITCYYIMMLFLN